MFYLQIVYTIVSSDPKIYNSLKYEVTCST